VEYVIQITKNVCNIYFTLIFYKFIMVCLYCYVM